MPIRGLTDRPSAFPEIGSVRKGAKKTDPRKPGGDLRYFRVEIDESQAQSRAEFVTAYGATPAELNIFLPFDDVERNFDAWLEGYTAGALVYRSDGDRVLYELDPRTGERLVLNGLPSKPHRANPIGTYIGQSGRPEPINAKPTGRLKVIIPELGRLAFLTVHTTSTHDVMNLSRQLQALLDIHGKLAGVPLKLRRRPVKISTPSGENGKRARREKWLLSVEADPEWVRAKLADMKRLALPDTEGMLSLPAPVVEHTPANHTTFPPGGYSEDDDDEGEFEEGDTATAVQAEPVAENGNGHTEPDLSGLTDTRPPTPPSAPTRASGTASMKALTPANQKAWQAGCKALAAKYPAYQTTLKGVPSGAVDYHHILGAAKVCLFNEITNETFAAALEAVTKRAAEKQAEPA